MAGGNLEQLRMTTAPDSQALAMLLAARVAGLLEGAVLARGRAGLCVSGGSTPRPFFEMLSRAAIPWDRVVVGLVDERWVEPDDADSNEGLVRRHLLQGPAAAATLVPMKNAAPTAGQGEEEAEARLRAGFPWPPDVLVLGMGGDGHTASLFPGAARLAEATALDSGRLCMALAPPAAPHERLSLTLPAILAARRLFLHITGADKRQVLEKALGPGPEEDMPVRFVLRRAPGLEVFWAG